MHRRLFVPAVPSTLLNTAAALGSSSGDVQSSAGVSSAFSSASQQQQLPPFVAATMVQQTRAFGFSRRYLSQAASNTESSGSSSSSISAGAVQEQLKQQQGATTAAAGAETKAGSKQSSPDAAAAAATSLQLRLPLYFHALDADELSDVHRVRDALDTGYFGHLRFKKGWAQPTMTKENLEPCFEEAAEAVHRIRHALDLRAKAASSSSGEEPAPVLRQLAGACPLYMHTEAAAQLYASCFKQGDGSSSSSSSAGASKNAEKEFTRQIVHHTLRDAMSYVEGLTAQDINLFFDALHAHRYDPCMHAQSVLRELSERHREMLAMRAELTDEAARCIEEGTELDKKWRVVIQRLYEANAAMADVKKCSSSSSVTAQQE